MTYERQVGDTPEMIRMCLNCDKPRCNNCLATVRKSTYMRINYADHLPEEERELKPRERLVLMFYPLVTRDSELAEKVGCSLPEANRIRNSLGLPPAMRLTIEQKEELVAEWLKQ